MVNVEEKIMVSSYSIRLKMQDRGIPNISVTNIGAYTVETEAEFVTFGTFDKSVFDRWIKEVIAAGIWYESTPK